MNDVSKPAVVAEPTYDYTQHPLSKRFPPYEEEQFDGLVRNIAKIGIRELPIWLFEVVLSVAPSAHPDRRGSGSTKEQFPQ